MSKLLNTLAAWKPFTALVIGDYMLDELVFGNVDRLCNDAPVPVLAVERTEARPGGAANVCLDLAVMRARVVALGVTGDDDAGRALARALQAAGVDPSGLVVDPTRPTTVKRSLIGLAQHRHAHKMFRMDYESTRPIDSAVVARVVAALRRELPGADVVCIEDYNKGVCTPELCAAVIAECRRAGTPVLVDPAAIADYSKYAGASAITPNRAEAELAAGEGRTGRDTPEEFADIAHRLVQSLSLDAAVITLDRHGALLLEAGPGREPTQVPTVARKVYDVTGAGDMVLAALAAARANGLEWFEAVRFANAAAGLEVEEFGVVPIPLERIHRDVLQRERATLGKLRTAAELQVELAALRHPTTNPGARPPRVVLTNGCFDVLHAGHAYLLRQAKAAGDFLIVAVNTDEKVRQYKGPGRPVNDQARRAEVLGALECVDAVVFFDTDTPVELIAQTRPDVLAKGSEYDEGHIPGAELVRSWGGEVLRIPMREGFSSTATLRKLGDPRAEIPTDPSRAARFTRDTGTPAGAPAGAQRP